MRTVQFYEEARIEPMLRSGNLTTGIASIRN